MKPLARAAAGRRAGADAGAPAAGRGSAGPGWEAAARRRQRGRVLRSPGGPRARPLAGLAAPGGNLRLRVPAPAAGPGEGGTPRGRSRAVPSPRRNPAAASSGRCGRRRGPGAAGPPRCRGAGGGAPSRAAARFLGAPSYFRGVGFPSGAAWRGMSGEPHPGAAP